MSSPAWPSWRDALPPSANGARRAEGGRRLRAGPRVVPAGEPLVSYVTVVRNAAGTLQRTIDSVQAQRWPHVEHVVVDGLSDDGTLAVVERNAERIDYYVSEPDRGLYDALNKAVELARGDLICVLNADDWLTADAASLAARAQQRAGAARARIVLCAAWVEHHGKSGLWLPQRVDAGAWLSCPNVCHNAIYATRSAYEASGPYDTRLRIAADSRWVLACLEAGVELCAVDTPAVHYQLGGLSSDTRHHAEECRQILHERFPFLDEGEAWGLMHAFHQFRPNLAPFAASKPPHLGRFLAALARRHAQRDDLMRALALAGFDVMQHPDDAEAPARLSRSQKVRRSMKRRWLSLRALWAR